MVATVAELSFWTSAADVPWGKNKANQFDAEKLVNAVRVRMSDSAAFSACRPEASLLRRCLEDRR